MHRSRLRVYFELHHGSLDKLASGTFEGPQIVSRLLWFNARQIHLCCALSGVGNRSPSGFRRDAGSRRSDF
jgi:hypothetical protein